MDLTTDRREYVRGALTEDAVGEEPLGLFSTWFEEARTRDVLDANAMVLATVRPDGMPDARVVLLKGFDADGFVFFTDRRSPKGEALAQNPRASLCFYWAAFDRQVRIYGTAAPLPDLESDAYFATRPRESQLSAWASSQSAVIATRNRLEEGVAQAATRFAGGVVPRPPYWGGYRIRPDEVEFWQGRENRLHDRFRFQRRESNWRVERLSP